MDWGRNTGLICVGRPEQYFGACWPHFFIRASLHRYIFSLDFFHIIWGNNEGWSTVMTLGQGSVEAARCQKFSSELGF